MVSRIVSQRALSNPRGYTVTVHLIALAKAQSREACLEPTGSEAGRRLTGAKDRRGVRSPWCLSVPSTSSGQA